MVITFVTGLMSGKGQGGCRGSVNALHLTWVVTEWVCLVGTD